MPGAPDPLYVRARRVLLDALDALGDQRRAVVLVGAQAVYFRVGRRTSPSRPTPRTPTWPSFPSSSWMSPRSPKR